ncbi:MAG: M6 family metalloprotease domain-containing protein [Muribaculaceae bacterium]|nr:M6 family metalloprotease domain-containing protein [Muribaculaceae bacterium]
MNFRKLLLTFLAVSLCVSAGAVPAKRGIFTVTQPDGTTLRVQRVGDEHLHFLLTEDRQLLVEGDDGAYYYSNLGNDGMLVNTGVLATDESQRTDAAHAVMQSYDRVPVADIRAKRMQARRATASRAIDQSGMGRFSGNFPRTGKVRGLVILVEYSDVKFTLKDPYAYFYNMLNQEGFSQYGATGSARDYFLENSQNLFQPDFDVYGPYTLPQKQAYYGANVSGEDKAPEDMIVHACKGLDSEINFADYDMDGDGYVDNVFVFYAGRGEASGGGANSVWPHQWELSSVRKSFKLDGKWIDKYACTNEYGSGKPDGVGTFIHEFSHVMGLPDLYETNNANKSVTPGEWSVLDYGPYNNDGRTPPNYSIFERNAMGWCEPRVLDGPESVTLENIAMSNDACIVPTTVSTEFFLIENRQNEGWDKYLPGHGMLIWHVDFKQNVWDQNSVNNTPSHMLVELEKADGPVRYEYYNGYAFPIEAGWSFPGEASVTSFTNSTVPSMETWNGLDIDMPITDIAEKNGIITFDIAGGGSRIDAPVISPDPVAVANGFTVSWSPVEGAIDYFVTVYKVKGAETVVQNYNSVTLPDGWSKSSGIGVYTSTSNFKTDGTSLKFSKTGHTLTTCDYEADVVGVSFWYKGQSTDGMSMLAVNGKIDGKWTLIATIAPVNGKATDYSIDDIPAGVKAIQFVYNKVSGNVALDDISVTSGGGTKELLPDYDSVSTGGATSITINVLPSRANDEERYLVGVRASNGDKESRESTIEVNLASLAGIGAPTVGGDYTVEYYNLQGIKVDNPQHGQIYIMGRGGVVSKVVY